MKVWNVAIYARVSSEKEEQRESVPAQVQSLQSWLLQKSKEDKEDVYSLIKVYEDRGVSGSSFNRESFQKMKGDIEQGIINMVLTRDLSRFGRNYILSGYFLEDFFKVNGVRFISVLDNVDTKNEIDDVVPFKNIINEMYIKDCSKRTRDGLKQRMVRGSCIASKAPFGYRRLVLDENGQKTIKLVPAGDESTDIVKEIFDLYLQGWGYSRIANHLNGKMVVPPGSRINFPVQKWDLWNANGIKSILQNPKYAGRMVQGQYRKLSYKVKKIVKVPQDEWYDAGEFEGIIPKELFDKVQVLIKKRARAYRYKNGDIHIFSGVLICGDCDSAMIFRKEYAGYKCANSQKGGGRCTSHSIKESFLIDIVHKDMISFSRSLDRDSIFEDTKDIVEKKYGDIKDRIKNINSELQKCDNKFKKLYEDRLSGIISIRNFENLSKEMQEKQELLNLEKVQCEGILNKMKNIEEEYSEFKVKIDSVLQFEQFSRNTIEELVDRIIVYEDKITGIKTIEIKYKFSMQPKEVNVSL